MADLRHNLGLKICDLLNLHILKCKKMSQKFVLILITKEDPAFRAWVEH